MYVYLASIALVVYVLIVPKEAECLSNTSVLLVTDSLLSGIYGVAENESELYYIRIQHIANPIALMYNYIDEHVYWTDVVRKEIRRTSIDGKTDTVLYDLGTDSIPDGLAVDCTSDLLFYSDAGQGHIAMMNLNGNNHVVVVSTDIFSPRSIVLDNVQGHIYWTDWGSKPKIETSDYDGMNRRVVINTGLFLPNGLAIDFKEKWIFWADAGTHFIEKSRLDGTHRTQIYFEEKAHFFSLLLLADNLYYTDWTKKSIMVLPVTGTEPSAYGRSTFSRPNDISLFGPMNTEKNGCSRKGVKCSHICIPKPGYTYSCMCPDGMYLQNRVNCIQRIDKSTGRSRKFCKALVTGAHMLVNPPECAYQDVAVGKRCVVSCEKKFLYSSGQGDITLECQDPGLWSDTLGTCVGIDKIPGRSRKFCKALVTGAHMLVNPPECAYQDVAVGKRCIVSCEKQFLYSSGQRDITLECQDPGLWSDKLGTCVGMDKTPGRSRKFCKPLVTGAHMLVNPPECAYQDVAVGKRCVVSCEKLFLYSSGQRDITLECQDPGLWSDKLETCVENEMTENVNCPDDMHVTVPKGQVTTKVSWPEIKVTDKNVLKPTILESIRNGSVLSEGEHTVNIFVIYNTGYIAGCQFNIFVNIIRCGKVPISKYAYLTFGWCEDFLGSVCTFSCITGYQFENETESLEAECGMDRNGVVTWKMGSVRCKPVTCQLNHHSDVIISGCSEPIVYGSVCEMECKEGYERVKGSRISICTHDEKMSGERLICREKQKMCKTLHQGQGVQITGCSEPFVVGTVCDQSCTTGFEKVIGTDIRFCRSDGIWTGNDIVCRHVIVDSSITWDRILPYGILLVITLIWLSCNIARYNQNRLGVQRVDH